MNRLYQASLAVATTAGILAVMTAGMLLVVQWQGKVPLHVKSTELKQLTQQLRRTPKDEALKEKIRKLDYEMREATFRRLHLSRSGAWMLFGAGAVFLCAAHFARQFHKSLPDPIRWGHRRPDEERQNTRMSRHAVAGCFVVALILAAGVAMRPVKLPVATRSGPPAEEPVTFPSPEQWLANWPQFRGPTGDGVARVPVDGAIKGKVLWKSPVPLPGMSSPVAWDDAVFVTGANESSRQVYRFDAGTGVLVWTADVAVRGAPSPKPKVTADTGYAAPTPVTDGQRVYAIFANMDVAAVDYSGKLVWARNLGRVENSYGHATSLLLFEGRLLVQVDHNDVDSAQSKLYALDVRTGREVWSVSRPVEAAWTTPLLMGLGDEAQLVTVAAPWMIAYQPRTGEELWRAECVSGETAPSPIVAGGFVLAISPHDSVVAMKTDGRGDVTKTHQAWKTGDGVPDICSPVCDGKWLYLLTTQGELRCLDASTGKEVWMHNYEKDFYASPVVSNGRLLLVSADGELHLLESGQVHKEIGKRALEEKVSASPVPHRAGLIVRGETNLWCIEAGKEE